MADNNEFNQLFDDVVSGLREYYRQPLGLPSVVTGLRERFGASFVSTGNAQHDYRQLRDLVEGAVCNLSARPTNADRAAWAEAAVRTFETETGMDKDGEDDETIIGDLVANLMHLCHNRGLDFAAIMAAARGHFGAELAEEAGAPVTAQDEVPAGVKERFVSLDWREVVGKHDRPVATVGSATLQAGKADSAAELCAEIARGLVINAPAWFAEPAFVAWLNSNAPKFTWHQGGTPGEWSDAVVLVDSGLSGEGSEGSDEAFPEHIWERIVEACRQHLGPSREGHYMVRITNL